MANLADEKHIKEGTYAVQNDGSVTLNYQDGNKKDLTETAKITGIAKQDLSNIDTAGKKVITGLGSIVEAGDNVTVTSTENATTGQKTYTVNAVTPVVYTTPSGDKLTKNLMVSSIRQMVLSILVGISLHPSKIQTLTAFR